LDELQNHRALEIEILNVDLGRVYARAGACDTTTACTGLFTAHNLHAVHKETPTLGRQRSLLQELFGNIGAVGQRGQSSPTADNPG